MRLHKRLGPLVGPSVHLLVGAHRLKLFVSLFTVEGRPLLGHLVKMYN
jgi:hypothetical protein